MPNYGNYRRPRVPIRGSFGIIKTWEYFPDYAHATEICGDQLAKEGTVTGPTQVRCPFHGWAPAGLGDYCAHCEQEAWEEELEKMDEEFMFLVAGDPYLDRGGV